MRDLFLEQLRSTLQKKRGGLPPEIRMELLPQARQYNDSEKKLDFWPASLYVDPDTKRPYAILTTYGRLHRAPLSLRQNQIVMGQPEQIDVYPQFLTNYEENLDTKERTQPFWDLKYMNRGPFAGHYAGFVEANRAILNKDGELDTRGLYQDMVERAANRDNAGYINFYHVGGAATRLGSVHRIMQDRHLLWAFAVFDADKFGMAAARTLANDVNGVWRSSMEYDPLAWERLEVARGIKLPMMTKGDFYGLTICKTEHAACWFTNGNGIYTEKKRMKHGDALWEIAAELLGSDKLVDSEKLADEFAERSNAGNGEVNGAVSRTVAGVDEDDDTGDHSGSEEPSTLRMAYDSEADEFIVDDNLARSFGELAVEVMVEDGLVFDQAREDAVVERVTEQVIGQVTERISSIVAAQLKPVIKKVDRTVEDDLEELRETMPKQPGTRRKRMRPSQDRKNGKNGDAAAKAAKRNEMWE